MLFIYRTLHIRPTPDDYASGLRDTSLDLFYESTELQRMAGDRNVRLAVVDDFGRAIRRG